MSQKIKLVALDLDGTLFNDKLEITAENQRAIREAADSGTHVIISTGRPYIALPLDKIADLGIRYAITANGGGIYRLPEKDCVFKRCMSPEIIVPIIRYLQTKNVLFDAFIDGIRYREPNRQHLVDHMSQFPEATKQLVKSNATFVDDLADFIENNQIDVEKMTLNFCPLPDGTYQDRDDVWEYLSGNPQITTLCGGYMNIEYTLAGTTKAMGLRYLADMLDVPMECTMAVGDTENDADIIEAAGIGVAMGNATNDVKAIADFISKSNNESGVAYAIDKFVLRKE